MMNRLGFWLVSIAIALFILTSCVFVVDQRQVGVLYSFGQIKTVKTEPRGSKTLATLYAAERKRIEAAIPRGSRTVVLDEHGTALRTTALAQRLKNWQLEGDDVALIIGGPDGLDPQLKQAAHERIRLSDLTLPHAMVRVLLIEQLYRAWSVNAGHPYHRE